MGSGRRSGERSRSDSRDRHRHRDSKHRHRSKSRDRSHRHSRDSTSHKHESRDRSRKHDRQDRHDRHPHQHAQRHDDRWESQNERPPDLRGAYVSKFSSGGRIYEDNGGLPLPDAYQGELDPYQAGNMDVAHQYGQYGSGLQEGGYTGQAGGPYASAQLGYNNNNGQYPQGEGQNNQLNGQHQGQHDQGGYNRGGRDQQGSQHQRQGFRGREPSSCLHVRGIPDEYDEADINRLFSAFSGVMHVRLVRDRGTGQSRGFGFVEMDSVESAQQIMETDMRYQFNLDGTPLRLDYSHAAQPAAAVSASANSDWVCPGCSSVNFSRRLECYRCCVAKPAHATMVTVQPDAPSHILKISGLEQQISEGNMHVAIAQHSSVKDIRLVLDKFTGAPRGFAFVHFHTVADASRVLHALQNVVIEGQETPLRLTFAKDKPAERPPPTSTLASDALQAAQAMSQYAGWEPKEFSEAQLDPQQPAWQPKEFNDPQDAQPQTAAPHADHHQQQQQQQQQLPQQTSEASMQWPQHHQQAQQVHDWNQGHGQEQAHAQGEGQSIEWQQEEQWPQQQQQQQWQPEQQEQPSGVDQQLSEQQQQQGQQHWPPPDHSQQWQQQQQQHPPSSGAEGGPRSDIIGFEQQPQHQLSQQLQQQEQNQPGPPGTDQAEEQQPQNGAGTSAQAGFVYDSASGYWHDAVSGYYYDANTGLYCHPQTQQWYSQDAATGEFTPYVADQGISGAAANALESTTAAVAAAQSLDHLHAPEVTVKAPGVKKKGAVIGSAPKLSHEGLVAAAKAAEEKVAAEAAAEKRAKLLAAKKAVAAAAKANKQKQKLAAAGGGIGFLPQPTQTAATEVHPTAMPGNALQADAAPQVQMAVVQPTAAEVASVQGKIHQGKWSRKK